MIEELTPQILMVTMFLVIIVAPVLTLPLSLFLLRRYRRAVELAMSVHSGFRAAGIGDSPQGSRGVGSAIENQAYRTDGEGMYRRAVIAPWQGALHYAIAGLVFALVFAAAAHYVYPTGFGPAGFLIAVWIYLWPVFMAVPLVVPGQQRRWAVWFLAYLVVYALLGFWASTILNYPEYRFGAVVVPARSSVTPATMIKLWLALNGGPSLLMLLCLNHWIRAVAPLVLSLVSAAVAGTLAAYFALFSTYGVDAVVALSESLGVHVFWLVLAGLLLSLLVFSLIGWGSMRLLARAYRRGRVSDQSLMLDALWLLFASTYSMWLMPGGLEWIAAAPVAFLMFKLTWALAARIAFAEVMPARGLTFLRVFALGRRTEALLEAVAKHWRYLGSIQLITGPDLARSTVQPHQFLDFLGGNLSRHFISDQASLERSVAGRDRGADLDGRFRINNFFCHADSWKVVLPKLVQEGDTVLMDLRSFSASNAGCIHEIRLLVAQIPFRRCLLVVDQTTDEGFLEDTLKQASSELASSSPNYGHPLQEVRKAYLDSESTTLRNLVHRLSEAASR